MRFFFILTLLFSFNVFAKPVNINSASAEEIAASLKGIGIKKANAIIQFRKKQGSFKSIDDLINVKGIGEKIILNNKQDIKISGKTNQKEKIKVKKQSKESSKAKKATKEKSKEESKAKKATKNKTKTTTKK